MEKNTRCGNPVLVEALDRLYGSDQEKQKIDMRDSDDVEKFLKKMDDWRKKSDSANMTFK